MNLKKFNHTRSRRNKVKKQVGDNPTRPKMKKNNKDAAMKAHATPFAQAKNLK